METEKISGLRKRFDSYVRRVISNYVKQVFRDRYSEFRFWQFRKDYDDCGWMPMMTRSRYGISDWEAGGRHQDVAGMFRLKSLERAFRTLTPKQKEVIILMFFAGMTYAEIGENLDIGYKTVASRRDRAIGKLRKGMAGRKKHGKKI